MTMERTIIALVVLSLGAVGGYWRCRREAEAPPPVVEPMIQLRTTCGVQEELWCALTLPGDATQEDLRLCATEYFHKCMSCLAAVDRDRRATGGRGLPDECQSLKYWRRHHPTSSPPAAGPPTTTPRISSPPQH